MITAKAFEMIDEASFQKALAQIYRYNEVIDTGYPVGMINRKNIDLIKTALETGKMVISLRPFEESRNLFGDAAEKILYCRGFSELLAVLDNEGKIEI